MFKADIDLLARVAAQYAPLASPIVDVGGLENPTVADYQKTIEAMNAIPWPFDRPMAENSSGYSERQRVVQAAQLARITRPSRPLAFLGDYVIENPEAGGLPLERLCERYDDTIGHMPLIGTAVLLSVLEHVGRPWMAVDDLHAAMKPGGLVVVSVPWAFPTHHGPKDCFRYSPDGLRGLFSDAAHWEILECDWHLRIPSDAGVFDLHTGRPQAIEACFLIARAR